MISTRGLQTPEEVTAAIDAAVTAAFLAESASRQRGPHHLGLSALGGCTREAAHAIAGTPPSNQPSPDEGRAANLGTWEHNGLLPRVAEILDDATTEADVTLHVDGQTITLALPGHVDLDAPETIVDLKTVAEYRLQEVRRAGPFPAHLLQVCAYALAKIQAGETIRWVSIIYMDRANGETLTVTEPYTTALALSVIDRIAEVQRYISAPDGAPRFTADGRRVYGPGFGFDCNRCHWLKRCWGPDAEPGKRPERQYDRADIEALLTEYEAVRADESAARKRKDEIAALLEDARHGQYGEIRYGRGSDVQMDDTAAALGILRELGYPIPQRWRRGSISVRRAKAAKTAKTAKTRAKKGASSP